MDETCQTILEKMTLHLTTKTASWTDAHLRTAIRDPATHALAQAIDAACLAQDFRATVQACRHYTKHLLAFPKDAP